MPAPSAPTTIAAGPARSTVSYRSRASASRPTAPDAGRADHLERLGEVGHGDHREVLGGARRCLDSRGGERCRVVARHHDAVRATCFRAARDGTDVLRILDAVEHHEQRRRTGLVEQVVEVERGPRMEVPGDPLVMLGVGDVVETLARHLLHEDVACLGVLEDLGEPRLRADRRRDDDLSRRDGPREVLRARDCARRGCPPRQPRRGDIRFQRWPWGVSSTSMPRLASCTRRWSDCAKSRAARAAARSSSHRCSSASGAA